MPTASVATPYTYSLSRPSEAITVNALATQTKTTERSSQAQAPNSGTILGAISWLMLNSPLHRHYTLADLETRILPGLFHNQYRFYQQGDRPIGFVNWAWLTEDCGREFATGTYALNHEDWTAGHQLWFPELIAPFGHAKAIVRDLGTNVLPKGTPAKALRINPDGSLRSAAKHRI